MQTWQLAFDTATPLDMLSRKQFFFTEKLPDGARNVRHVYAPVEKLGVTLEATEPWEGHNISAFAGTVLRLDNGRFRLYYTSFPAGHTEFWIAVAESGDGLHWDKPRLGQVIVDGQDTNRLLIQNEPARQSGGVAQPQVLRLPSGEWRMYYWRHTDAQGDTNYHVAHSPDGLHWSMDPARPCVLAAAWHRGAATVEDGWTPERVSPPVAADEAAELRRRKAIRTNDANFIYFDERLGRYENYSPWLVPGVPDRMVNEDNAPWAHRFLQRRLSSDGLTWSAPELIVKPDERDPWDLQFYHMAVQRHEDWMIGSLGHYRVEQGQQTQDLELVFSRDGRAWNRPLRGGFIPRDPLSPVSRDSAGIYPSNAWIDEGETWLGLYTATHLVHNCALEKHDSRKTAVMAARWKKNRFVGIGADRVPGGFLTDVFYPQGDEIAIDADIRGWLRAELCDVFGRKRPGYHLMDSIPVGGDSTSHVLRWKDKSTACFRHDAVRVRFEFADGAIYSLGF